MFVFLKKTSLTMTQTIGQRLRAGREAQRLSLEKVFEATRIRIQYLEAIEADDLSAMPSPVQARGYLRNYAEFLGLDVEQILSDLRDLNAQEPPTGVVGPAQHAAAPAGPVEAEAEPPPATGVTVPVKRAAGRRKKTVAEPGPASAEPRTRRRGAKNEALEAAPAPQPESAAGPAPVVSAGDEPSLPAAPEAPGEELPAGPPGEADARPPQVEVSDSLWQTWLNRIGTLLPARTRERSETVAGTPPEPAPVDAIAPSPVEVEHRLHEQSGQILREIGSELRQRRELLSLHFDEVERHTHVKAHYLEALERGALDELPSTVQTRGMLSNYATFLDLDVDTLLLRFADALQAWHREKNPHRQGRQPGQPIVPNIPPVRSFIAGDMIFGVGMAVLLVGFAIWGVSRVIAIQSQEQVEPTAPSISDVLLASPDPSSFTATATFLPAVEAFPGEATVTLEIPTQNVNAEVQLNLVAVERTYLRVIVDGEEAFDGRVLPGNAYPFEAETQIEVLAGSGAAIRVVYNGRDLGLLGTFGQVVNNIYLGTEIVTPTGLPTLTPTVTLTPTATAPPTSTLRATSTPAPSATAAP